MPVLPTITTQRLTLRPFSPTDAARVQELAGDREVADPTANIPHPYPDGMAEAWIATHAPEYQLGTHLTLAITEGGPILGAITLRLESHQFRAELGYWVGRPYWGRGYATEAAAALVEYGFRQLGLRRIYANHFARNPASGRVMEKIGMRHEGVQRQHSWKEGRAEDLVRYGILVGDPHPGPR